MRNNSTFITKMYKRFVLLVQLTDYGSRTTIFIMCALLGELERKRNAFKVAQLVTNFSYYQFPVPSF